MKRGILLVGLGALALSSCAPPGTYRHLRSHIRRLAERELGPADKYEVTTSRDDPARLFKGKVSRVEVHGVNVRPAPGYVLDEVFVSARNIRLSRGHKEVKSAEETVARAYITEASLAEMVDAEGTVKDSTVTISPDRVQLSGKYAAFGALPMDIMAVGTVQRVGSAGVQFVSDSVTASGIPMPMKVNRSFDFARLYPALLLTNITTEKGRIVLNGTLDWSKLRSARSDPD